jgi:hypothetical protein
MELVNIYDFFKDEEGKVVIGQKPNIPLYVALLFYLLRFMPFSNFNLVSDWGFVLTMLYWSYLELFFGVNYFRKLLGLSVGSYFLYRMFNLLF